LPLVGDHRGKAPGLIQSANPKGKVGLVAPRALQRFIGDVAGENLFRVSLQGGHSIDPFRFAYPLARESDYDLLPWFAATLVDHKVAAIISGGGPAALAAKSATTSVPIIFSSRTDPIQLGLITALKQPGTNITGVISMSDGFVVKQIKLIH
jgi:hypothetical protein